MGKEFELFTEERNEVDPARSGKFDNDAPS